MAETMTAELPLDVLMLQILSKLPAKYLVRFMSVSKQWKSFLKSTMFANIHLHNVRNDYHHNHLKCLVVSKERPFTFSTIDCEAPDDGLTASRPLPFEISHGNTFSVIASCNGLVCVGVLKSSYDEYSDFILWNPLTGEYKILLKANFNKNCYHNYGYPFALYYNSFDEDYNLLHVTNDHEYNIYSLKNDSWRRVVNSTIQSCWRPPYSWRPISIWSNENLYFLQEHLARWFKKFTYPIIRFDIKTGKFHEITTPSFERNTWLKCLSFTCERGYINLCLMVDIDGKEWCMESWRMDGNGDWKKVSSYCWKLCLENSGGIKMSPIFLQALHLMRNGSLLMTNFDDRDHLYKIDMEKHSCNELSSYTSKGMYILPTTGKYMETLVSPNQYIN